MLSLPNLIFEVFFRNLDVNKHKTPPISNIKTGKAKKKKNEEKIKFDNDTPLCASIKLPRICLFISTYLKNMKNMY